MASSIARASTSVAATSVAGASVQKVQVRSFVSCIPVRGSSFRGQRLAAVQSGHRTVMEEGKAGEQKQSSGQKSTAVKPPEEAKGKEEGKPFTPPTLDSSIPSPIFGGSTGGLLRKAQVEEFYVITFESPKEQIFELPTGGAAIARKGPNLLKLARKEQCLALGTQLRNKFKISYQFYRVYPSGEVQYLHPKDGVYPEKVNAGRKGVNMNSRSIGENGEPVDVKFSGKKTWAQ